MVRVGKICSAILAVFAILMAPLMSNAPEGLYQLMQKLNGFFYVPLGAIMLAGFFLKYVSPAGAKVSLAVGIAFYFTTTFIIDTGIHFVHLFGIMFLIMIATMYIVSYFYPVSKIFKVHDARVIDLKEWKYAKHAAVVIAALTISIYLLLGSFA
jgi:SSS family solute:Na+ symporter